MTVGINVKYRGHLKQAWAVTVLFAAAALLAACAEGPEHFAGPSPADPSVRVAATTYQPVIVPYKSMRPAQPAPWRQQNEKVAPSSGPEK